MAIDPNWFLSAEIQSSAAMVAIIGGQLISVGIKRSDQIDIHGLNIIRLKSDISIEEEQLSLFRESIYGEYLFRYLHFNHIIFDFLEGNEQTEFKQKLPPFSEKLNLQFHNLIKQLPEIVTFIIQNDCEYGYDELSEIVIKKFSNDIFSGEILKQLVARLNLYDHEAQKKEIEDILKYKKASDVTVGEVLQISIKHPKLFKKEFALWRGQKYEAFESLISDYNEIFLRYEFLENQLNGELTALEVIKKGKNLADSFNQLIIIVVGGIVFPSLSIILLLIYTEWNTYLNVLNFVVFAVMLLIFFCQLNKMIFEYPFDKKNK